MKLPDRERTKASRYSDTPETGVTLVLFFASIGTRLPTSRRKLQMKFCSRLLFVSAIVLVLSTVTHAQQVSDGPDVPGLEAFDVAMLDFMQAHNIPDGQLAVTWQGRLVLARAYDNQSENPVNLKSLFRIASVSKPLTSTIMHRLQQDGGISTSDRFSKYLDVMPPLGQTNDPRTGDITIRNMLEHLGGFDTALGYDPVFHDAGVAQELGVNLPVLKSHIRTFMNGKNLANDPGTTYNYSNYGYLLAGQMIEAATGLSYGAYADSVLNKIGIFDARLARSQKHRAYSPEAVYFSGNRGTSVMDSSGELLPWEYGALNMENATAFGGWDFNMVEAARWLVSLNDPSAEDALLDEQSLASMFGLPENWIGAYTPGDYYYSMGWQVRDYGNGNRNTWHNGSLPGTTAQVVRFRDGFQYAAAFNRRNENAPGTWIADLETRLFTARNSVTQWPDHNLFPELLAPVPEPVSALYSGSWYDITHNGEGFVVQIVDKTTSVVYWFTYDREGNQRWYFGVGEFDGHRMVVRDLLEGSGGKFGPDFNPDDVTFETVGSLAISIFDGERGKADYLLKGDSGYMELSRLSQTFDNDDPATAGDWRTGLWYDPSHNGEGFVVEVLPGNTTLVYWFTYDGEGRSAWMVSASDQGSLDSAVNLSMARPIGGNFGVGFDPDLVTRPPNGILTLRLSCSALSVGQYSGGDGLFPKVDQILTRLAGYADIPCSP